MDVNSFLIIWNAIPAYIQTAIVIIGGVVTLANTITMATPTKVDDEKWGKAAPYINAVLTVLNTLALNVFKNTNADAVSSKNQKPDAK